MTMTKYIKYSIRVLITPSCWLRNASLDKEWDKQLNQMLDNEPIFSNHRTYTIYMNNLEIWISNRYYASPYIYYASPYIYRKSDRLPSRKTTLKFFDTLDKVIKESKKVSKKEIKKKELIQYVNKYIHYLTLANGDKNIAFRFLIDNYPKVKEINNFKEKVLEMVLDTNKKEEVNCRR